MSPRLDCKLKLPVSHIRISTPHLTMNQTQYMKPSSSSHLLMKLFCQRNIHSSFIRSYTIQNVFHHATVHYLTLLHIISLQKHSRCLPQSYLSGRIFPTLERHKRKLSTSSAHCGYLHALL